jgi:hypothetical protein
LPKIAENCDHNIGPRPSTKRKSQQKIVYGHARLMDETDLAIMTLAAPVLDQKLCKQKV